MATPKKTHTRKPRTKAPKKTSKKTRVTKPRPAKKTTHKKKSTRSRSKRKPPLKVWKRLLAGAKKNVAKLEGIVKRHSRSGKA